MAPSSSEPHERNDSSFTDVHDVEVAFRSWKPATARGVVLVLHGASEHSGRYQRFANALVEAGWAVYAPDHRGHGNTARVTGRGSPGPGGVEAILDDVHELRLNAARDLDGDHLPVVVFGHSMGSVLALAYTQRFGADLAGVALCGTAGVADGIDDLAAAVAAAVDGGMGQEKVDALSPFNEGFQPARTSFDWLSRDEAEVDAYIADPDCGDAIGMTYEFLAGILAITAGATSAEAIASTPQSVPILLITGERDPASNDATNVRRLDVALRETDHQVTSHYYADARHELLNETNRAEVTTDVLAWLDERG
jgi:alpha-beta hydrolase superfamily lysophospholipase